MNKPFLDAIEVRGIWIPRDTWKKLQVHAIINDATPGGLISKLIQAEFSKKK